MPPTTHVNWAFSVTGLTSTEQILLLRLAHYADMFEVCRPSTARLADESSLSRATVFRTLSALEGKGLLSREEGSKTTIYVLSKPSKKSRGETGGLTMRHESISTTSSTRSTTNLYLSPSGRVQPRPAGAPPKEVDYSQVVKKGWDEAMKRISESRRRKPAKSRPAKPKSVKPRKGTNVSTPGFEKKPAPKRRRGEVDDTSHLASVGRIAKRQPVAKKQKPIENWLATDFTRYLTRLARQKAPTLTDQVQQGWARGDFARWLREGASPEAIKDCIDRFIGDPANTRPHRLTIWQRFRVYYIANQYEAHARIQRDKDIQEYEAPQTPRRGESNHEHGERVRREIAERQAAEARRLAEIEAEQERLAEIELEAMLAERRAQ